MHVNRSNQLKSEAIREMHGVASEYLVSLLVKNYYFSSATVMLLITGFSEQDSMNCFVHFSHFSWHQDSHSCCCVALLFLVKEVLPFASYYFPFRFLLCFILNPFSYTFSHSSSSCISFFLFHFVSFSLSLSLSQIFSPPITLFFCHIS